MIKKGIFFTIFILLLLSGATAAFLKINSKNIHVLKTSSPSLSSIDFSVMEDIPLKENKQEYSRIIDAVMEQKNMLQFTDNAKTKEIMNYFMCNNPLSLLVESYTISETNHQMLITYRFSREEQVNMVTEIENTVQKALESITSLGDFQKILSIYSYYSQHFPYQEKSKLPFFDMFISHLADSSSMSAICVFTLLQLPVEARLVEIYEEEHLFFMAKINDSWYYFDAAKEAAETKGKGLYYFAMHDSRLEMIYNSSSLSVCYINSDEQPPSCSLMKNYSFYKAADYEIIDTANIRLSSEDGTLIAFNMDTFDKKLLLQKGFTETTTSDGYHYYLYSPCINKEEEKKYPLIIVLHGAFGQNTALDTLALPFKEKNFQDTLGGAYILLLISNKDYYTNTDRYMTLIKNVLEEEENINRDTIILYGHSNGAKFACELIENNHAFFHCAILGGCLYECRTPESFQDTSVWLYYGELESEIIKSGSDRLYQKLLKSGCDITLVTYPNKGHTPVSVTEHPEDTESYAMDWLLKLL